MKLRLGVSIRVGLLAILATQVASGSVRVMRWTEIEQLASRNGELMEQAQLIRQQGFLSRAAYSGFMPQVSTYFSRARQEQSVRGFDTVDNGTEYGVKATLAIFNGFATLGAVRRENADLAAAELQRTLTAVDVRYRLRQAYFQLLLGQDELQLALKLAERRKLNLQMIRLKYESGTEPFWSVQQAEAELGRENVSVQNREMDLTKARINLAYLLNLPPDEEFSVDPSAEQELFRTLPDGLKADSIVEKHPELKFLQAKIDSAREEIRITDSGFYPSVAAELLASKKIPNDSDAINTTRVGLSVSFPIFEGLSTYNNSRAARSARDALETRQAYATREIKTQIELAEKDLSLSLKRIPVARDLLTAAQSRAKTINQQYRIGLKDFIEWEQAEQRLISAERDEIEARRTALSARAEWERVCGESLK